MTKLYIIAEAAQGYEGSESTCILLVRAAAAAGADAIKFQMVYARDLAQPDYQHFDLFKSLEMSLDAWRRVRQAAAAAKIEFVVDVFGPESMMTAEAIGVDAVKLHSTTFFDRALRTRVFALGKRVFGSIGGILPEETLAMVAELDQDQKARYILLYGYQAEPTPLERNNLARIPALREITGLDIGFMDHSDGDSTENIELSVLALGLGVRVFEKHITLDRALGMEDYVSALGPSDFRRYVDTLRRLVAAIGTADLLLTPDELEYRRRALKRVVASRDLAAGRIVALSDLTLTRTAALLGMFDPAVALGRSLRTAKKKGDAIDSGDLT